MIDPTSKKKASLIAHLKKEVSVDLGIIESMVENVVEGVVMLDQAKHPVIINSKARVMLDLSLKGKISPKALSKAFYKFGIEEKIAAVADVPDSAHGEYEAGFPQNMIIKYVVTPVHDKKENEVVGMIIMLRDVTEEISIEKRKTEFVSTVSHELRTPLSIIKEAVELVIEGVVGKLSTEQADILGSAKVNVNRLSRIINSLLDISKIEAGKVETFRSYVDLERVIGHTVAHHQTFAANKGLTLYFNKTGGPVKAYVDEDKINQIFTNLISNAIKFTSLGRIEVAIKNQADKVRLIVQDTGRGIAPQDVKKLFSKFEQFGRQAGSGEKGTGLGLAIVKKLVEMHEGEIKVESKINAGTKFIITLPKALSFSFFQREVKEELKKTLRERRPYSMLVMALSDFKDKESLLGKENLASFLFLLSQYVYKKVDQVMGLSIILAAGELYAAFPGAPKEEVLVVEGEVKQATHEFLEKEKSDLSFKLAVVTSPADGDTPHQLIKTARSKFK